MPGMCTWHAHVHVHVHVHMYRAHRAQVDDADAVTLPQPIAERVHAPAAGRVRAGPLGEIVGRWWGGQVGVAGGWQAGRWQAGGRQVAGGWQAGGRLVGGLTLG